MRNVMLACVVAASLAACSWTHRDRNMESSGTTAPPTAQAQSQPSNSGTSTGATKPNWNKCDEHPYAPGPARKCE